MSDSGKFQANLAPGPNLLAMWGGPSSSFPSFNLKAIDSILLPLGKRHEKKGIVFSKNQIHLCAPMLWWFSHKKQNEVLTIEKGIVLSRFS
jgi:hypothetical protein